MTSVEDTIANLTYYVIENARLKRELEDVRFMLSVEKATVAEAFAIIHRETARIKEENDRMEKQIAAAFNAIDMCREENSQLEQQLEKLKRQS